MAVESLSSGVAARVVEQVSSEIDVTSRTMIGVNGFICADKTGDWMLKRATRGRPYAAEDSGAR